MYCPTCNIEYRTGFTTCADCGASLLEGLPPEPSPERDEAPASLVQVCLADDPLQAELVAATLREQGIEAFVRTRFVGGMTLTPSETHWAPGQQRIVLVPALAEAQAREIVASVASAEPEPDLLPSPEPIEPGQFTFRSGTRLGATIVVAPILAILLYGVLVVIRELLR